MIKKIPLKKVARSVILRSMVMVGIPDPVALSYINEIFEMHRFPIKDTF